MFLKNKKKIKQNKQKKFGKLPSFVRKIEEVKIGKNMSGKHSLYSTIIGGGGRAITKCDPKCISVKMIPNTRKPYHRGTLEV